MGQSQPNRLRPLNDFEWTSKSWLMDNFKICIKYRLSTILRWGPGYVVPSILQTQHLTLTDLDDLALRTASMPAGGAGAEWLWAIWFLKGYTSSGIFLPVLVHLLGRHSSVNFFFVFFGHLQRPFYRLVLFYTHLLPYWVPWLKPPHQQLQEPPLPGDCHPMLTYLCVAVDLPCFCFHPWAHLTSFSDWLTGFSHLQFSPNGISDMLYSYHFLALFE